MKNSRDSNLSFDNVQAVIYTDSGHPYSLFTVLSPLVSERYCPQRFEMGRLTPSCFSCYLIIRTQLNITVESS